MPDALLAIQEEQHGTGHAVRVAMEAVAAAGERADGHGAGGVRRHPAAGGRVAADLRRGARGRPAGGEHPVRRGGRPATATAGWSATTTARSRGSSRSRTRPTSSGRIREINSGILAFDAAFLIEALPKLSNDNAKGEYYLTDTVHLAREAGLHVGAHEIADVLQTEGVNDRVQLARTGRVMNDRIVTRWMEAGVSVMDPATTWVDADVVLNPDVTLLPGVQLLGATVVDEDAVIGPDTTLKDCEIGAGARVTRTHGELAVIGAGATVGPFAYLRPGTTLGVDGKIGTFVETKNAQIGDGAKVPHLSYVGDAEIGEGSNIGAGTIFANYDGVEKNRTVVGRHAKTGSNNTFVAPVEIGDGAGTAGGTVVRRNVPPGALAVSGGPQRNLGAGRCRSGRAPPRRTRRRRPSRAWKNLCTRWGLTPAETEQPGAPTRMTGMKRTTEKNLMVFSGRAHPQLAEEVTELLGTDLVPQSAYEFANSEIYVRYEESVRGCDAFVLQSHTAPINEWIMEHLIMVDALKRASAKRITVVMPFYGYARQDKKHRGREPISARLMADLFKTAGADRLITVDLHADQIQGFFDGPVDHLMALPILADHVRAKYGDQELAVVSPDAGRIKVAERWAARLGGAPLAFIHKSRNIDRPNETVANRVVGDVKGRICVLVDDMIDTGGTITKAAEALMADGAAGVVIAATHAILSEPAVDRLKNCPAQEVVVTNTLPLTPDREFDKLTQLSIAPLVARAIREVFEDGSVTSMFDGHA